MAVVVLGNRLESTKIHDQLRGRMNVGIEAFRETESDWLVLSGAATNPKIPTAECEVMREYAVGKGVDPSVIVCDDKAKDTVGNGYFSRLTVDELDGVEVVYVVSSCYHMERAEFIFNRCFGPEYTIDASYCFEFTETPEVDAERAKLEQVRALFAPVEPGDIDAVREQIINEHSLYSEGDV